MQNSKMWSNVPRTVSSHFKGFWEIISQLFLSDEFLWFSSSSKWILISFFMLFILKFLNEGTVEIFFEEKFDTFIYKSFSATYQNCSRRAHTRDCFPFDACRQGTNIGPCGVRALPCSRANIVAVINGVIFSSYFFLFVSPRPLLFYQKEGDGFWNFAWASNSKEY